jgi:hypothetical protein
METTELEEILLDNKNKIHQLSQLQYDFEPEVVKDNLLSLFCPNAVIQLCFPFERMTDVEEFFEQALMPLFQSISDLERIDTIIMSGPTTKGSTWVGCCGFYCGTFDKPWLNIPARAIWSRYAFMSSINLKVIRSQNIKQFGIFLTL